MHRLVVMVVSCWLAGCATFGSARSLGEERFPRRDELAAMAQKPAPLDTTKLDAAAVDSWTLAGPFPTHAAATPATPATPWQRAAAATGALTEDMGCVAREVGRFMLAKNAYPGHSLQAFIEDRCGSTASDVHLRSLTGTVPASVTDDEWFAQWKTQLDGELRAQPGAAQLVGIWAHREGEKAVMVVAAGDVAAKLSQPVPLVPHGEKSVVLRGRLTTNGAERVAALVNQGATGVAACKTLDALTLPDFAFECPLEASDELTTVEMAAFEPGRILGSSVARFLLWPAGTPRDEWRRPAGSTDVPTGQLVPRFIEAVNALRTKASLPALTEAQEQSRAAAQLAPHYWAAQFGQENAETADVIALGMMAGWDVGIDIVSAGFGSEWLAGTRDMSVMTEFVLRSPWARKALLDPKATHVAVGTVEREGQASMSALYATYVPLGVFDRKASEVAIITRLNQLRLDRGKGLAQWTLWPEDAGQLVADRLAARSWKPDDALSYVLERTAAVAKGEVTGYVQLVDDLENFQFPPEVLLREQVNVFLSVGVYRASHWAHSRYVVCFVLAKSSDIEVALALSQRP